MNLNFVAAAFAVILAFETSEGTLACQHNTSYACKVTLPGPSLAGCGGSTIHKSMTLLEEFLRTQCDVEDPCEQITPPATPYSEYDFIVVGGGSAGAVVASRLSEVPSWTVLLVEAGVNEPTGSQVPSFFLNSQGTSVDWQYKTEPEEEACLGYAEQRCSWPRGKVIGGTSVLHGMMYTRGNRKDYDKWEALGNPGWSYKQVLPYFLKSENNLQVDEMDPGYHGVGGLLPVSRFPYVPPMAKDILAAAEELGLRVGDLNGEHQAGFAIAQTNSLNGIRYSSSRAFLRPFLHRPNLHILLNTTATRVLIHSKTKRAYGVEVITTLGAKLNITAKKEIVVSGGAVNSPHILLLSGIGNKTELKKVNVPVVHDLPGVGQNLHNHVSFKLEFSINETSTNDLNWDSAMQYMLSRQGPLSGTALTQVTGFVKSKFTTASDDYPDIQLFFAGYLASCADTGDLDKLASSTRRVVSISPTVIQTKSTGYLTLRDNDPLSHPKIFGKYLTNRRDVEILIDAIKISLNLTKTHSLGVKHNFTLIYTPTPGCESITFGSDEYWECAIRRDTAPENHQAGSCKMGPATDPMAVVDSSLRVHGIKGLRVADASIMPRMVAGNPHGPIVMIGEKAAAMIKNTWSTISLRRTEQFAK